MYSISSSEMTGFLYRGGSASVMKTVLPSAFVYEVSSNKSCESCGEDDDDEDNDVGIDAAFNLSNAASELKALQSGLFTFRTMLFGGQ